MDLRRQQRAVHVEDLQIIVQREPYEIRQETMRKTRQVTPKALLAAALCAGLAAPAGAHHSVASFDRSKPEVVSGTVKSWTWSNPHCWLVLTVPDGKGGTQTWNFEGISATGFAREGYGINTLKSGETIRMLFAPRRDGAIGGEFLKVLLLNGQPFTAKTGS